MNFECDPVLLSRTERSLIKKSTYTGVGGVGASVEAEASGGAGVDAGSVAPGARKAYASFASSHSSLTAASVSPRRRFNSGCSHCSKVSDNLHTPLTALVKEVIQVIPIIDHLSFSRQAIARLYSVR